MAGTRAVRKPLIVPKPRWVNWCAASNAVCFPNNTPATTIQVDVRAACLGECRAQFGITKGATQHDEPADDPSGKNQGGCADGAGHVTGDKKNARADGVANNDRSRRPQTQAAN